MFTKAKLFNLALSALLLSKQISDTETDTSTEAKVLRTHYDIALRKALQDMDLNAASVTETLELVEEDPNDLWDYAYKYPTNCSFLRRIVSGYNKDNRTTQIPRATGVHEGVKVIFTNEMEADAEYIPHDIGLAQLSASAGMAISYQLAILAAPLIVGKGADKLRTNLYEMYKVYKAEAQEHDRLENASFDEDSGESEFVESRLS
jgi:hypothetical protein